jgi:hypothetical protein
MLNKVRGWDQLTLDESETIFAALKGLTDNARLSGVLED